MTKLPVFFLLLFSFISCFQEKDTSSKTFIQVHSGETDREKSIVSVESTQFQEGKDYILIDENDQKIPAQISGRKLIFMISSLSAMEEKTFEVVPSDKNQQLKTGIRFTEDAVEILNDQDSPVLQYRTGPGGLNLQNVDEIFYRGGYLHPLYSPAGHKITEQYTQGRPHQNGIWTGWYKTDWNGMSPDFWSPAERTGVVEVQSVDHLQTGPVYAELQATHHFIEKITGDSIPVLSDIWTIQVYNNHAEDALNTHVFDMKVQQENISDHAFTLFEHIYGGVGFRGSDQWLGEENMQLITSEGENREEAHMSRARWVVMSGEIDNEMSGIAILTHPDNRRFPEPVFINQREPFFTFAPLQLGDLILEPGDEFHAKYRYVIFDGEIPPRDHIERLWQDYAHPVEAKIATQ